MNLLLILILSGVVWAQDSCRDLFANSFLRVDERIDRVYITQTQLGVDYARYKLYQKAKVKSDLDFADLSGKQQKKLQEYMQELLKEELPAVRSPRGEYFILDGHHDLYGVLLSGMEVREWMVHLEIVKDYALEGYTHEAFVADMRSRDWMDSDYLLHQPQSLFLLNDSPSRSLIGLAFKQISKKYDVPLQGKHFRPRVQFHLAEFLQQEGYYQFSQDRIRPEMVEEFSDFLLSHPETLGFLVQNMNPDGSKKLLRFLVHQWDRRLRSKSGGSEGLTSSLTDP